MSTDSATNAPDLRQRIRGLYEDLSPAGFKFRMALLSIDIITVLYFVASTFVPHTGVLRVIDMAIGAFFLVELLVRVWLRDRAFRFIFHPMTLLDMAVIASLFAPVFVGNLLYLRLLRTLRLFHSYAVLEELRRNSSYIRKHVEVIISATHLTVFLFITTALIYVLQRDSNPLINNYLDALYFSVATLTTTGYGDITLAGTEGKILAIAMMVIGVSLFIRLLQALFQPRDNNSDDAAVESPTHCPHCGKELTGQSPASGD